MSTLQHEGTTSFGGADTTPSIGEWYRQGIDDANAELESRQLSVITHKELLLNGDSFDLVTYTPSDKLRTFKTDEGIKVSYPELLMVHGVGSDSRYFGPLFQKMNKLGIRCSAVTLPRVHDILPDSKELLQWQVDATILAHDSIAAEHPESQVLLGGHSHGAIIAAKALKKLHSERDPSAVADGLLLLAPAGLDTYRPKNLGIAALNLIPLAYNSLRHSDSKRLVGSYALMVTQVVLANPGQTAVEIMQALRMNVGSILTHDLPNVSVFIPAATKDEFIDHKKILKVAELAPNSNISVATLDTNHMLGERGDADIVSLGDPRLLSGQILAWLQGRTVGYQPLSVRPDGTIGRL